MPALEGNNFVLLRGNINKTTATMDEIKEYTLHGLEPDGDVSKDYVDTELAKKADKSQLNKEGVGLQFVDNTSDLLKPVSQVQQAALNLKADKNQLNRSGVGLGNVDNTSDMNKPVSTATNAALNLKADKTSLVAVGDELINTTNEFNERIAENRTAIIGLQNTKADKVTVALKADKTEVAKKVDLEGLLKTIDSTPAIVHTGETEVDVFKLDYGQHLIRTNNAKNSPPDTFITLIDVIKTHDEVGSGGVGQIMRVEDFEQGTVSETNPVGVPYSQSKYPATEPLHGSRIRNIDPIAITEFSTISIAAGYQYCVLAFDAEQKYLGKSTFIGWDSVPRMTYPNAVYISVAVKKLGANIPITPEDAVNAKVTITTLGQTSGGSKLLVAWGATLGDLHTCVNIAGAWSPWRKIGTQLPQDAEEGSTLAFKGGKWVAVPPQVPSGSEPRTPV